MNKKGKYRYRFKGSTPDPEQPAKYTSLDLLLIDGDTGGVFRACMTR